MREPLFRGSATALITPMRDGKVDVAALNRLVYMQIAGGTSALVACGTTGEPSTLSAEERELVVRETVAAARGQIPVICGTGSNNTQAVIENEKRFRDLGCAAQLVVTPYYNKTTQEGLYAHFMHIAENTELPIIVYNVPGRTNLDIAPETLSRLCESGRFVALKESSYDLPRVMEKMNVVEGKMDVYCGNDDSIVEIPISLANAVYYMNTNETKDLTGTVVNAPDEYGKETTEVFNEGVIVKIGEENYTLGVYFTVHEVYDIFSGELLRYEAYLCEGKGNNVGGTFKRATTVKSMFDNIYFGTENGVICSFNFDKRDSQGEIAPQYYTFDDRTIYCGCATKMDCCGIPHLTKNTVKKSTVIKTKSFRSSAAKIKVRTNKKPYTQIARINSSLFSFDDMDFTDFTFITSEQSLFAIKEKEKQWVEKQYYIYSDEYMKPFALYYVSFRYNVAGRVKN